jgi:fructosamine-3-kinase
VPTTYLVSEQLTGTPFDWVEGAPGEAALLQLGEHLARMHDATATTHGFGIYATGGEFPAAEWWPRFGKSYRVLADELCRASAPVTSIRPELDRALEQAAATGAPTRFALICQDQTPTHYLNRGDGTISGMVDIEAHLWAPADYEIATVEIWAKDRAALRQGYERHGTWPETLEAARSAYWFYTWMEWLYCAYTMLHDEAAAADLEQHFVVNCREMMRTGTTAR